MEKIKLKLKKQYIIALAVVGELLVALIIGLIIVLNKPQRIEKPKEEPKQVEENEEISIISQDQLRL